MARLGAYELPDGQFPDRIQCHRLEFPEVEVLEQVAAALSQADFPANASFRFLRQVCRWGGRYGIAARVLGANQPEAITGAFRDAFALLGNGDRVGALVAINALHGLGRPAFASKFLRFMAPQFAAILDRIISAGTGFPLNPGGYGQLVDACHVVAAHLAKVGVANPTRSGGVWYIADIEAAFYADMEGFDA